MMDKNREAFEAAYSKFYDYEIRFEKAINGYRYKHEDAAWWAWNAFRQAIELKKKPYCVWPDETHDDSYINGFNDALDEVTSLGIRVKGNEE